jgi:hypothetical protein
MTNGFRNLLQMKFTTCFPIIEKELGKVGRSNTIVAILIESRKFDSVVSTIADQAKSAAEQCSGMRPAVIAIQIVDQTDRSALAEMLNTPNGLHAIAHQVFKGLKRLHVDSITYTVPPLPTEQSGSRRFSAPALTLFNPKPKFACPEARSIFST